MCGISGIVALGNSSVSKKDLESMTNIIEHRGPDGFGYYVDETESVGIGHRRLSIIDLSERGAQPMRLGDVSISYNGEVYNYLELRKELENCGHTFESESDTEVILTSYMEWGEQCVHKFNGMWAMIIFDGRNGRVFCSRDRFGIKPFYWYQNEGFLFLASEIKQFTQVTGWQSELNKSKAIDYLESGFISHTDETMFSNVFELRGGYNLIVDLLTKKFEVNRYYEIPIKVAEADYKSANNDFSRFKEVMSDAVKISLRSDVKVGSALSGGLDSSVISLLSAEFLANESKSQLQECISACFDDKSVDESFYIEKVAEKGRFTSHKVFPKFDDFLTELEKVIWHQDEPFISMSILAQYMVFQKAKKENILVMLDGQGADEILAGYGSFYPPVIKRGLKSPVGSLASFRYFIKERGGIVNFLKFKFQKSESSSILNDNFKKGHNSSVFRRPSTSVNDISKDYLEHFGLHALLKFEDRNSMAWSVESRVPFLDYRVVEFAMTLPEKLKINRGIRKYILRESFRNELPVEVYKRKDKYGFPTPQEQWTLDNLEDFHSLLSDASLKLEQLGVLEQGYFDNINLLGGNLSKNIIFQSWRVIFFAKWLKIYNVKVS